MWRCLGLGILFTEYYYSLEVLDGAVGYNVVSGLLGYVTHGFWNNLSWIMDPVMGRIPLGCQRSPTCCREHSDVWSLSPCPALRLHLILFSSTSDRCRVRKGSISPRAALQLQPSIAGMIALRSCNVQQTSQKTWWLLTHSPTRPRR